MIQHGHSPYLECSSRGDRRFSALYARILRRDFRTIEEIYQSSKVFSEADGRPPGLKAEQSWRDAKGRRALNQEAVSILYHRLWEEYLEENLYLLDVLRAASGLSDIFGQPGHMCQASVLWYIRAGGLPATPASSVLYDENGVAGVLT